MSRSSEEGYRVFRWIAKLATRRHRLLLVLWVLVFVGALAANQVWRADDVITYYQSAVLPEDTESAKAQDLVDAQFPGQAANSSATVVVVANNVSLSAYREFVIDLQDTIGAMAALEEGENATLRLQTGEDFVVDGPLFFLKDGGNATIYAVYESYASTLAEQFGGPVHLQNLTTQSAVGIYWGLPGYFLSVWVNETYFGNPAVANETAHAATQAFMGATFPPEAIPWANGSFETYYQGWRASFSNPAMDPLLPDARTEAVIAQTLPAFVYTPVWNATFGGNDTVRMFQLGMLAVFDLANAQDAALAEAYALSAFPPIGVAEEPFFRDVLHDLPENATDAELRAFARLEVLRYSVDETPLLLPLDVARFFLSEDRQILLMNYAFDKDARYTDADRRQPVVESVLAMRDLVARMLDAYRSVPGFNAQVYVTGSAPLSIDEEFLLGGGAEFIATIVLVVVLIGLYFRSVLSPAFPILTIGVAILVSYLFVYFVAVYVFSLHFTATAVLQTVLLAAGTDYSIFLIARYRDERQDGKDKAQAVYNSVVWAGESVATSGGAVLISFAALSIASFPIVKGMGLTIGFGVTVALALALTFVPPVLMVLGDRVFWPSGHRVARVRKKGELTASERYFHGAADFSMRHARAVVLVALLVTVPAMYLVITDTPSFDLSEGVPPTESSRGLDAISDSFGHGFFFPTVVVVWFSDPVVADGTVDVAAFDAIDRVRARLLAEEPAVKSVEGPTNPQGSRVDYRNLSAMPAFERDAVLAAMSPYIGADNRTVQVHAVLVDPPFSREAIATIDRVDTLLDRIQADEPELQGATIYLGGVSAIMNDIRDTTNRDLQIMAALVVTGLFLVLLFVLGSVLIPLRAVLTILLSIAWTLALTIVVFHAWQGLDIVFVLPLVMFVMAMGLGMDYDIFIITRVREEVAKGKTDRDAIREAVTRTGGIISACGIVMAGAFATLIISPLPFLQQIGFALAAVILIDSTVVRIYLVPAIMVLAGKYNWWAPGRLQRVRREEKDAANDAKSP